MPASDPRDVPCPVCGWPADSGGLTGPAEKTCAECGWPLWVRRRPGPVTEELRKEFDQRLAAARRRVDAKAAALITDDPGRFASWIRGGPPDSAEWATARREADASRDGAIGEESAREHLATVLRDLTDGTRIVIIEIGPEGIGVVRAATDKAGTPRLDRDRPVAAWAELLPMLSREPDESLFQLAGGIACLDRPALGARLADIVPTVVGTAQDREAPAPDTLVICQPAGWPLLEDAARYCRQALAPVRLLRVEGMPAIGNGLAGPVVAGMPSLRGYGMVGATIQPTGAVRLATRPLFSPGDLPGTEAFLTLRRVPGDQAPVTLGIAVDGQPSESAGEPTVISAHTFPRPADPAYQVRAVLEAPGRIRFTEPDGIVARSWTKVSAAIPRRVNMRPGPVDLVCAVELTGTKEQVDLRRDLVRELLEELAAEYPDLDPVPLRIGLLGCTDHVFEPGEAKRRIVRRTPLEAPTLTLASLARFRGAEIRYPPAAPLEDLMHEAHRMLTASRDAGHVPRLLVVAGRAPHPPRLGQDKVQPCPFQCDWRRTARALAASGTEVVAVTDTRPTRAARAAFWTEAAPAGLHPLPEADVREVAEDLGVLIRQEQHIGIPLLEEGT